MDQADLPMMQTIAPVVDQVRFLARDAMPEPQTVRVMLYDDADYDIVVIHSMGDEGRQQVVYDRDSGAVRHQRTKGTEGWGGPLEFSDDGEPIEPEFEIFEEEIITTLDAPEEMRR